MPFTLTHPAAVLPLVRTPLPSSALVIGSMSPDLPLRLIGTATAHSHSAGGLFGVDLAFGLVMWVLWHGLLSGPALAAAPVAVRVRCARLTIGLGPRLRDPRRLAAVPVALVVGGATHVLIDSFTHIDRWGVRRLPALSEVYAGHAGYSYLQYGGSVLGMAVIALWLRRIWNRSPTAASTADEPAVIAGLRWGPLAAWTAIAAAGGVGALIGVAAYPAGSGWLVLGYLMMIRAGVLVAVAAGLLALTWHLRRAVRAV